MVNRILRVLNKEVSGLHQAAYLLAFFSLGSQILALVRDRLLAYTFGANHSLDLYYAAFRIPDFIFVSVASMVSISVLIPFLMERIERDTQEAKRFIDSLFTAFFLIISIVSLIAFFLVPYLVPRLFPDFGSDFQSLILMTRVLLLSPIFLGFSNFLASITQIYKRFFIYALSPILYNFGIIFGIVFLYPRWGIYGLVWGVVLGALLHVLIQVPFVVSKKMFPRFTFPLEWKLVRRVILVSLPRTVTVSSNEIAELFLISMASVLANGSISVFSFSFNLQSVPLSIVGVSYSLAAFPALTRMFTKGEENKFVEQMIITSQHIIFWATPIMVLLVVLRAQIVRVLLGAGNFNWSDTRLTAAALALFVLSLVPQCLTMLFVRAYYSRGNTWKPLLMNIGSAAIIVFSSWGLVTLFDHWLDFRFFVESLLKVSDIPAAVLMLPLGFTIGSIFNVVVHWIAFHRDYRQYSAPVLATLFETSGASILMGFAAYNALNIFDNIFPLSTFWGVAIQGLLSGIVGILVGVGILVLLRNKQIKDIWSAFHKKIWGVAVIGPDPEM